MNKIEILLTDGMRSRIYETGVDRNPWFILEKLKKKIYERHIRTVTVPCLSISLPLGRLDVLGLAKVVGIKT